MSYNSKEEIQQLLAPDRARTTSSRSIKFYEDEEKQSLCDCSFSFKKKKFSRVMKVLSIMCCMVLILFAGTIFYVLIEDDEPGVCCTFPFPQIYRAPKLGSGDKIVIDGRLDDAAWAKASQSPLFVDIQGSPPKPYPRFKTWVKMRWDDSNLYVGAWMQETALWANQTERDSIIYLDNDFELFVDPDGDNHWYKEFEVNAINTVWDLEMNKPYRDGGVNNNSYTIAGLETAIHTDGVANDPSVPVTFWSFEGKFPLSQLAEGSQVVTPPKSKSWWRINFSRVEWQVYVQDGKYYKVPGSCTSWTCPPGGVPEDNWVWSPQGAVNMHMPEKWGFLYFDTEPFSLSSEEFLVEIATEWRVRSILMQVYYAEQRYFKFFNKFTDDLDLLDLPECIDDEACNTSLELRLDDVYGFVATIEYETKGTKHTARVRGDSLINVY